MMLQFILVGMSNRIVYVEYICVIYFFILRGASNARDTFGLVHIKIDRGR